MSVLRINWATRIALLYGGFVVLIATLVVGSMRQNFDLVSADYYEHELKYQDVLDAGKNSLTLSAPLTLNASPKELALRFPAEFIDKEVSGLVHFYSAVDASWDKTVSFATNNGKAGFDRSELKATTYTAKVSWNCEGKHFYQEIRLNLGNNG